MPHFIASRSLYRQSKNFEKNVFLVDSRCHPQSIAVVETRAKFLGIEMMVADYRDFDFSTGRVCGALVQYPNTDGQINDYTDMIDKAHKNEVCTVYVELIYNVGRLSLHVHCTYTVS